MPKQVRNRNHRVAEDVPDRVEKGVDDDSDRSILFSQRVKPQF